MRFRIKRHGLVAIPGHVDRALVSGYEGGVAAAAVKEAAVL